MYQTKGAIGNLINRYRAVLKKCHLLNTFGSLAVAGMLVMGSAGLAHAVDAHYSATNGQTITIDDTSYEATNEYAAYATSTDDDSTLTLKGTNISLTSTITDLTDAWIAVARAQGNGSAAPVIYLGDPEGTTESVQIEINDSRTDAGVIGLWAAGTTSNVAGGQIVVQADTVSISVTATGEGAMAYGICAQNSTSAAVSDFATITIDADQTYIDTEMAYDGYDGGAAAIVAMSQGIVNISGDLYVNTRNGNSDAIATRGNSQITINEDGTGTVQMYGDINFNYDGPTSGTVINSDVSITLSGEDSVWEGNARVSWTGNPSDPTTYLSVDSMELTVQDNATWRATYVETVNGTTGQDYLALNQLTLDSGNIIVEEDAEIVIEESSGTGTLDIESGGSATFEAGTLDDLQVSMSEGSLNFGESMTSTISALEGTGELNNAGDLSFTDTINAQEIAVTNEGSITVESGETTIGVLTIAEGGDVTVGGEGEAATLYVTSLTQEEGSTTTVGNLGTLATTIDVTIDENGDVTNITGVTGEGTTTVNAGGTYKVTLDNVTSLDSDQANAIAEALLGEDTTSKIYLAGVTVTDRVITDEGHPHYVYEDIKDDKFITDAYRESTVDVTNTYGAINGDEVGDGVSGVFQQVHLTGDSWETNNDPSGDSYTLVVNDLTLRGFADSAEDLVYYLGQNEETEEYGKTYTGSLRVKGVATLGDIEAENKGTLNKVILAAQDATLNVLGKGEGGANFTVTELVVGQYTDTTVNIDGATLNVGTMTTDGEWYEALDKASITDGSFVVENGDIDIVTATLSSGYLSAESGDVNITGDVDVTQDSSIEASAKADDEGNVSGGNVTITGNANINDSSIVANALADGEGNVTGGNVTINGTTDIINSSIEANGGDVTLEDVNLDNGTITATVYPTTDSEAEASGGDITINGTLTGSGTIVADENLTLASNYTSPDDEDAQLSLKGTDVTTQGLDSSEGKGTISIVAEETLTTNGEVSLYDDSVTAGTWVLADGSDGDGNTVTGSLTAAGSTVIRIDAFGISGEETETSTLNKAVSIDDQSILVHGDKDYSLSDIAAIKEEVGHEGSTYVAASSLELDGGSLKVGVADNDTYTDTDSVVFGSNSLLVVDNNALYGDSENRTGAEIFTSATDDATATVVDGSQLYIVNAQYEDSFIVFGDSFETDAQWAEENLLTDSDMLNAEYADDGQTIVISVNDAQDVYPGLSDDLAPAVNDLYTGRLNDPDSKYEGIKFLTRATNKGYLGSDKAAAASTIESAARIAFAGAVPQMTKMASDAATNAVVNRLGIANPGSGVKAMDAEGRLVDDKVHGFALWIAPLWQNQSGFGMEAGNLDYGYNANLGGVSIGADYTFDNSIRAGIMFNIGGGYAESSGGDLSDTTNSMTFWGIGAYGGWNYKNFAIMGDVSYTSTWNSIDQDVDHRMGMSDLEADIQASAISAGLRFEYKLETDYLDFIPHVGVRYMSINTWGYDVDNGAGTVLEGDGFQQNIWTFPVGITFAKDFTLDNGWYVKPALDFTIIPAAGDIKAKEDVRFTGMPHSYEVETQMMDYFTWQGGAGIEFGNDTVSVGINYTLQAGQNSTGHGVFGMFRYEF